MPILCVLTHGEAKPMSLIYVKTQKITTLTEITETAWQTGLPKSFYPKQLQNQGG